MDTDTLLTQAQGYFLAAFDGVIRIEIIDADTSLWVDGRQTPPIVSPSSPKGVERRFCLWRIEAADLSLILTRTQLRLENSLVAGRLHISGDMAVMMRLEAVHD